MLTWTNLAVRIDKEDPYFVNFTSTFQLTARLKLFNFLKQWIQVRHRLHASKIVTNKEKRAFVDFEEDTALLNFFQTKTLSALDEAGLKRQVHTMITTISNQRKKSELEERWEKRRWSSLGSQSIVIGIKKNMNDGSLRISSEGDAGNRGPDARQTAKDELERQSQTCLRLRISEDKDDKEGPPASPHSDSEEESFTTPSGETRTGRSSTLFGTVSHTRRLSMSKVIKTDIERDTYQFTKSLSAMSSFAEIEERDVAPPIPDLPKAVQSRTNKKKPKKYEKYSNDKEFNSSTDEYVSERKTSYARSSSGWFTLSDDEEKDVELLGKLLEEKKLQIVDLSPLEMARQLTLIDHAIFRSIHPYELLHQGWTQSKADFYFV